MLASRKEYAAIAEIFGKDDSTSIATVVELASVLKGLNDKFDTGRFYEAAGLTVGLPVRATEDVVESV